MMKKNVEKTTLSLFVHFLYFFFVIKINTIKKRFYFSKTFLFVVLFFFLSVHSSLFILILRL